MSGTQQLKFLMQERLTAAVEAAVEEIFVLLEKTICEYQEEVVESKREVVLLKQEIKQLSTLKPQVQLYRIDSQPVSEEPPPLHQLNPWQEPMSSQDDMVVQQYPQVKEEQEDFSIIPDYVTTATQSVSNSVTNAFVQSETKGDSELFPPHITVTMATNHDDKNNESEGQNLMMCDSDFLTMEQMICRFCRKQFYTHSDLAMHVEESHLGQNPYRCATCGMEFTRRDQWTVHYLCHTGVNPHSCPVCGQMFIHRQGLTVHMRIHPSVKPYSCPVCSKLFAQRSILNDHMEQAHTDPKPSCPMCGKTFSHIVGLQGHMRLKCGKLVNRTTHLKGWET